MSLFKTMLFCVCLTAFMPLIAAGQSNFERHEYSVDASMINVNERQAVDQSNRDAVDSISKKDEDLQAERQIRDRKIELDTQLAIDTARIQKKEIDLEALESQKNKLLESSRKKYERALQDFKQSIRVRTYSLPDEDFAYTITIADSRLTTSSWIEILVKTKEGLVPFYAYQYYDRNVSKSVLFTEGQIAISFKSEITDYAVGKHKMKIPLGLNIVVYSQTQSR